MACPSLAEASLMDTSIIDVSELMWEVTQNSSEIIKQKLSKLTDMLKDFSRSLEQQSKLTTETERQVSNMEDQIANLELCLVQVESRQVTMADQLDDVENQSRRDNIWILNLKKGMKGGHPLKFFESWLPALLGLPPKGV